MIAAAVSKERANRDNTSKGHKAIVVGVKSWPHSHYSSVHARFYRGFSRCTDSAIPAEGGGGGWSLTRGEGVSSYFITNAALADLGISKML